MPQQNTGFLNPVRSTPPQQLQQVLDPLNVPNDFKATIWDSYVSANTPQDFRQRFDNMAIPDDVKAKLWDLKFGHAGTGGPPPSPTATAGRNLEGQAARHAGTAEAIASTLPMAGAGIYGAAGAGAGLGLVGSSLLTGTGAGAGEAVNQMLQHLIQSKNAPQTSGEAAGRIGSEFASQAALEAGTGLAMKPLQWLLRGTTPVKDAYTDLLARVNRQYGLRLTAPELSGGTAAATLQHVANRGLLGQPVATAAVRQGRNAAQDLIDSQLGFISRPSATAIEVGEGVQNATLNSSKLIHDVLGRNVGSAAEMLKDTPVNTVPFKQWALQEWQRANLVGEVLGNSGEDGAAKALGFASPAEAKSKVPPAVWQQIVAATKAAPVEGAVSKPVTQILGKPDNTVSGVLKDILKLPDQTSFSVLNKYKQDLFELNPTKPTPFKDKAVGLAKAANAKLTGLMEDTVKGTPAGDAWIRARGEYAKAAQLFTPSENQPYTGKFIQQILSSKPEDVVGLIKSESDVNSLRAAITDYASLGNVNDIQQASDTFRSVQRKYVEGLVKGDGSPNAIYSLKGRLNDNPAAQALFKDNPEVYNNLRLVADAMARVQKMGSVNVLGQTTAQHLVAKLGVAGTLGLFGGGLGYAESGGQLGPTLATALAFELVPYGISKVIYSRPLTELMIRGLGGMAAESHIGGLAMAGKGAVKAAPFVGTGAADVIRAIQLADRLNPPAAPVTTPAGSGTQSTQP